MITTLLFDLARVFLFPKDKSYRGELNTLHRSLKDNLDYKFFDHFEFNEDLFTLVEKLKQRADIYMFTSGTIQETPEVKIKTEGLFKEIFSAEKLRLRKTDPASYFTLCEMLSKNPEEILFIDDSPENLNAAQDANLSTILFTNTPQFTNELKNFIDFAI